MKDTFKRLIVDFHEREIPVLTPREIDYPFDSNKIISFIGVRRSGKTSILLHGTSELRKKIDTTHIVYLNFEDDRLSTATLTDLDQILEAYYELYPARRNQKTYWFIDEIQAITGWEKFIRRLHDTEKSQIFISGSSARLLSSELATSLRGRTIAFEVFPFSFTEYLRYQQVNINLDSSDSRSWIKHHFNHYLSHGGFAECFNQNDDIERRILRDYLDLIIYRDIIERFGVTNRALLKHLIRYLFANPATLVSYNKLYNDFRSQGYKLSKDTLIDYFSYLNDAYAAFNIPVFRPSIKEEQRNPRKFYIIDNNFKRLYDAFARADTGKLYENLVFLHLRRQTAEIYYLKGKFEVDFYAMGHLINVCAHLNQNSTRQREIRALEEGMINLNIQQSYLLTADQEEKIPTQTGNIHVIPVWKWLCQ